MLFLIGSSNPQESQRLRIESSNGKSQDILFKILIILIGIFKFVAVMALGVTRNPFFFIPIAILYAFVCYVHITHTGYYLAYENTEKMLKKQYDLYGTQGIHAARTLRHAFSTANQIHLPVKIGDIEIRENPVMQDGSGNFHYILETKGILIDDDIPLLINGQQPNVQDIIALECRKHQLNMCPVLA